MQSLTTHAMVVKHSVSAAVRLLLVVFAWLCALFWLAVIFRLYVSDRFSESFAPRILYKYGDAEADLFKKSSLANVSHFSAGACFPANRLLVYKFVMNTEQNLAIMSENVEHLS